MEFAYRKLLAENNLTVSDLNEDAKNGIDTLVAMERAVNMALKGSKKVSEKTYSKIKTNDRWVCMEILEQLDGKKRNDDNDAPPIDIKDVEDQIKIDNTEPNKNAILDVELDAIFKEGLAELSMQYVKEKAPNCYNLVFDNYEADGENGLVTTNFSLIEIKDKKQTFTLTKIK
jgi:hypothetical protein